MSRILPQNRVQDCAAATQTILLACHALGLGAVWIGVYPRDERVLALRAPEPARDREAALRDRPAGGAPRIGRALPPGIGSTKSGGDGALGWR